MLLMPIITFFTNFSLPNIILRRNKMTKYALNILTVTFTVTLLNFVAVKGMSEEAACQILCSGPDPDEGYQSEVTSRMSWNPPPPVTRYWEETLDQSFKDYIPVPKRIDPNGGGLVGQTRGGSFTKPGIYRNRMKPIYSPRPSSLSGKSGDTGVRPTGDVPPAEPTGDNPPRPLEGSPDPNPAANANPPISADPAPTAAPVNASPQPPSPAGPAPAPTAPASPSGAAANPPAKKE